MIRILYVNGGCMDRGGISVFMMNYYRHMPHDRIQIDFAVHTGKGVFDEEIRELGGQVYYLPDKKRHPGGYLTQVHQLLHSGTYRIVHTQMNAMNGFFLQQAKFNGIPVRISHSHGSAIATEGFLRQLPHRYARRVLRECATHRWACSEAAGRFLYGKKPFEIIPNAIELERFAFDEVTRWAVRQELGIGEQYVIGHVGHFEPVKNHRFLINIFTEVVKVRNNTRLLLVGDGTLQGEIRVACQQLGILDKVIFAGRRADVERLYNAMDCLLLPSLHEGFPMSVVEAQANGLACLLSNRVPEDVCLTPDTERIDLEDRQAWTARLCGMIDRGSIRDGEAPGVLREKGYDIRCAANILTQRYVQMQEKPVQNDVIITHKNN